MYTIKFTSAYKKNYKRIKKQFAAAAAALSYTVREPLQSGK